MLIDYVLGQTSIILRVAIRQSISGANPGSGLTGLTPSSAGLIIGAIADNEASGKAYTQTGGTIQTITTLGLFAAPSANNCRFGEVDNTNHKGVYEIQLDNTRYAVSNAKSLLVSWTGAANMLDGRCVIPLRAVNPYDAVAFGITDIPAIKAQTDQLGFVGANVKANVQVNADKTGYSLTQAFPANFSNLAIDSTGRVVLQPSGVDAIVIETGLNLRQAISITLAESAGTLAGSGTGTIVFAGAGVSTTRITTTVDGTGNRTAQTLNPPP